MHLFWYNRNFAIRRNVLRRGMMACHLSKKLTTLALTECRFLSPLCVHERQLRIKLGVLGGLPSYSCALSIETCRCYALYTVVRTVVPVTPA